VTAYRFDGSCSTEQFEFIGNSEDDAEIVAHIRVTSWHPYEVDAVPSAMKPQRNRLAASSFSDNIAAYQCGA